jgi:F-type H+-transporting ATPase subunit g
MSLSATRAVLRQASRVTGRTARRFESTTAKATEAAKDTASKASQTATEYKSKASEGLSRVTSSAGPAISGAAKSVGNALGRIGGRTGRLIAFVESVYFKKRLHERLYVFLNSIANGPSTGQIPPAIYYARVGLELSKLVFQGQKMTPP